MTESFWVGSRFSKMSWVRLIISPFKPNDFFEIFSYQNNRVKFGQIGKNYPTRILRTIFA